MTEQKALETEPVKGPDPILPPKSELFRTAWPLATEMVEVYKALALSEPVHTGRKGAETVSFALDTDALWNVAIASVGIANKDIRMAEAQKLKETQPATEPQKKFIRDLIAQGRIQAGKDVDKLTASEASEMISKAKGGR